MIGSRTTFLKATKNLNLSIFRWRIARDPCGRAYYYNVETNECQWDPPPEATEGATSEDQLEEDEVTEADITIVEMEVEASDGKIFSGIYALAW